MAHQLTSPTGARVIQLVMDSGSHIYQPVTMAAGSRTTSPAIVVQFARLGASEHLAKTKRQAALGQLYEKSEKEHHNSSVLTEAFASAPLQIIGERGCQK